MEEEREGLTLGGILHVIFSQKWLALIIAAVLTVGITLTLYFGYNPQVTDYVSTFTVSFPGSEGSNSTYLFLDISNFQFQEIISRDNLYWAKTCNEENFERFEYIDVEAMHLNNDISIIKRGDEQPSYTIRVNSKYFRSRNDATDFIDALAQKPIDYIMSQAIAQDVYLSRFEKAEFYEDKCSLLKKQVEFLKGRLNELSARTAGSLKNDCIGLLTELGFYGEQLNSTIAYMRDGHYVHDADKVQKEYELQKAALEIDLESLTRQLELIFGRIRDGDLTIDIAQATSRVEALAKQIAETEERIYVYDTYYIGQSLNDTDDEFEGKLADLYGQLTDLTKEYEANLKQYCTSSSMIVYDGAIVKEGDLHVIVCLLIGLIVGLVVATIVAYVVGAYKLRKAAGTTQIPPAYTDGNAEK